MSFISETKGRVYAPGFFLADPENCQRGTRQMSADKGVSGTYGTKYIPMGTIYPAKDSTAEGIVYEDVDVTNGDMPGSVVLSGTVYTNRLPETLTDTVKNALTAKGFKFITEPTVTRPE
ncbi:MAG: hypothetical protein K2K02_04715 [Ruminococcus sp.]|nr:hypothetical protein [Ruminococcus sp.]